MAEPLPASPIAPVTQQKGAPISWPEKVSLRAVPSMRTQGRGFDDELKSSIQRSWASAQSVASRIARRLGARARYLRRERPLEVIAGFAIAGFLAGVGLRIWRSHHE
jgi:hypothetical protein